MTYSDERVTIGSHRPRQVSSFKTWVLVIVPLAAILYQVYVPLFFQFLGYLEMPLLVVVYFAIMKRSPIRGLFIGAAVGLVQDSLSKNPLGMFGITKTLVGYLASSIGVRLNVDQSLIRFLLAYFFFLFHQGFYWILARALLRQPLPFDPLRTLVVALFNAVVATLMYPLLDKLRQKS